MNISIHLSYHVLIMYAHWKHYHTNGQRFLGLTHYYSSMYVAGDAHITFILFLPLFNHSRKYDNMYHQKIESDVM